MIRRVWTTLIVIPLLLTVHQAESQQASPIEGEVLAVGQLFQQGKVRQAAEKLQAIILNEPNLIAKAWLQRQLLEICATGYYWRCVDETLKQVVPLLKSEEKLRILYPDIVLYEAKLMQWHNNDAYLTQLVRSGGAYSVASPVPHASLFSELALALHGYHLRKMDAHSAETIRSSATLGLLLTEPKNTFAIAKVLVDLIEAMLDGQDVVGAWSLAVEVEGFLLKSVHTDSVLHARYRNLVGQLCPLPTHTTAPSPTLRRHRSSLNSSQLTRE
jgi:hypothetical protein